MLIANYHDFGRYKIVIVEGNYLLQIVGILNFFLAHESRYESNFVLNLL